ncbi:MAG: hypothetical protein HYY62_07950 [Deltaproteobacteria bacterium]|nr:hypothetical protein [Deltaproteobacteria bacterium]
MNKMKAKLILIITFLLMPSLSFAQGLFGGNPFTGSQVTRGGFTGTETRYYTPDGKQVGSSLTDRSGYKMGWNYFTGEMTKHYDSLGHEVGNSVRDTSGYKRGYNYFTASSGKLCEKNIFRWKSRNKAL